MITTNTEDVANSNSINAFSTSTKPSPNTANASSAYGFSENFKEWPETLR
jgi:hypothetical protein